MDPKLHSDKRELTRNRVSSFDSLTESAYLVHQTVSKMPSPGPAAKPASSRLQDCRKVSRRIVTMADTTRRATQAGAVVTLTSSARTAATEPPTSPSTDAEENQRSIPTTMASASATAKKSISAAPPQ